MLGTWSSPPVTGDVPGGNAGFAFTKVSPHQVIRCGGWTRTIHMLDLSTMVSMKYKTQHMIVLFILFLFSTGLDYIQVDLTWVSILLLHV